MDGPGGKRRPDQTGAGAQLSAHDSAGLEALRFLERSRDVASEIVIDGVSTKTSTSEREDTPDPRTRTSVG